MFVMKSKQPFRVYHLRRLDLFHICNSWSLIHRGYSICDWEYFGTKNPDWFGFKDLDYSHHNKPRPRKHPVRSYVQLTLNFDL